MIFFTDPDLYEWLIVSIGVVGLVALAVFDLVRFGEAAVAVVR